LMDGTAQEQTLSRVLRALSWSVMRSPGSGTGDWDQPDVVAGRDGALMMIELRSGATPRNLQGSKVDALKRVSADFVACALVGVRYKGDRTFYLVPPERLSRTSAGRYSIDNDADSLPWVWAIEYDPDCPVGGLTAQMPTSEQDQKDESLIEYCDRIAAVQRQATIGIATAGDADV